MNKRGMENKMLKTVLYPGKLLRALYHIMYEPYHELINRETHL